ncbi:Putative uncharacterized protein FLJ37770 [Araneus ventricosus]|uniref:Mos1 transposase HTH domain-containing protein n=1 Tax=Araneus ventricosus TaxID=182803 RepID=A0A4Y2HEC5_ARAVE|nr:Putative uncharacterized protein FLJ37770 [Araneus ventricosus]GBM63625.1 Putative uncharacterized protein FLJ37770 [Araneus ventricosus]
MEKRVNIKFCFNLGQTAMETHEMLVKVYGVEAVSKKCVFEWFKRFRDGKEDVKDEPRSGRPPTSTTPDKVRRMLADDRRLPLRMIAEELKISLDSVSNIIHEHLQKRKKKVYAFPTSLRSSNVWQRCFERYRKKSLLTVSSSCTTDVRSVL